MNFIKRIEWKLYKKKKRKKLKNTSFSIISSNCNGGMILHDMGLRFNSPTVNLLFEASDFIKFVGNLEHYLSCELTECESDKDYPVGKIDDIKVYFMHYKSFEEAEKKWFERAERIVWDNIFVIATDKDGCTYDDLCAFEKLPYEHKVIFTHRDYPELKSAYYIKGYENCDEVGILSDFRPGFFRRRYIDVFDYVSFLNGKSVEQINKERRDSK